MRRQISVIGSGCANAELAALARDVGRLLAERGCTVVCGGLGGVMEEAARGAREAGGDALGILPGASRLAANPWVGPVVATGMGEARNVAVVASGDAVIAIGGEWGTLSEIGLARKLGREVVLLEPGFALAGAGLHPAGSAEEAVELALRLASTALDETA